MDLAVNHFVCLSECFWLMPVNALCLGMEKKFSTMALSKQFPRLDMDGVMPHFFVRLRYLLILYSRLISFWLLPAAICFLTSSLMAAGYCFIPFLPDMETPPDVVLFSYIRGLLVYCPFLLVRFITNRLIISFGLTLPFLEKSQVCVASRFCQLIALSLNYVRHSGQLSPSSS